MGNDSYISLPIKGRQITQLRLDFAFGLVINDEDYEFSIRINTMFTLTTPAGCMECDPEELAGCSSALRLFNAQVTSAKAFQKGRLEIKFLDDTILAADPNPQFEAWEVVDNEGMRIVATPGGELGVWRSPSSDGL